MTPEQQKRLDALNARLTELRAKYLNKEITLNAIPLFITQVDAFGDQPHLGFVSHKQHPTAPMINGWVHLSLINS